MTRLVMFAAGGVHLGAHHPGVRLLAAHADVDGPADQGYRYGQTERG